jgi:hypothetical protein
MPRGGVPILPFARKDVHLSDTHVVFNDDPLRYMASVEQQMNLTHSAGFSFVSACAGTDADGRRLALIFQEYPEPVRFRRQKAVAEEHHVDRFIADYRHAVGSDPFEHVRRGPDPPDFSVSVDGTDIGLDVTHLVLRERVEAHEGLQELRQAAQIRGAKTFRHLRGHVVYVALVSREYRWKPMIEKTLDAIELLDPRPRPKNMWDPDRPGDPQKIATIGDNEGWVSAGSLNRVAPGPFYGQMGFDLIQCQSTVLYADDAWNMFQRLVSDHDKPGIDRLLVTVAAPVGGGYAFPSGIVTGELVTERAEAGNALEADHIQQVYLHCWPLRSIDVFEPGKAEPTEIASALEVIESEDLKRAFFAHDSEPFLDWDADELVGHGMADLFVRHNTETGERQVFQRTDEIRDGLGVWRRVNPLEFPESESEAG